MTPKEQKIIEAIRSPYNKYSIPICWAAAIVTRARREGRIADDVAVALIFTVGCLPVFVLHTVDLPSKSL
jgi:hypothetical protein